MNTLVKAIRNPKKAIRVSLGRIVDTFVNVLPDQLFIKLQFRINVGYWPNLKNPKSFNEKLQWLKFNDIHPEYTKLVDKVDAKLYVESIVGNKYIIPTLGVWDNVEDIDWASLPNQFVVKATNDSGGVVVCKDKNKLDIEQARIKLKGLGGRDYTLYNKEYPYHDVPHRFIAEAYMEDESGYELKDYKIFCSYGKPKFLFVATGRQQHDTRFDFYDTEFNHLPVLNGHDNADTWPTKPQNYAEMLEVAAKLSEGFPQIRVDLYNCNGKIYFGELTFFHWSGTVPFEPREWDYKFGEMITLPYERK
ncbi:MAG: ATP-grasp fold amidoligase family protein [Prevotellaceae bacterium]|nr:ATP-grasp fold amidoligase family protein [Prevotellaceae bacterium]